MATTQSIKILEDCRVTPLTNSSLSATEFTLPLTYFDIMWLKFYPIERIFFYELAQHESTRTHFNSVILPKLKHSLSLTLVHFLPLVGNITWSVNVKKPCIIYTPNDGISFIVAESNSDFNFLCRNEMLEAANLHPYVPELAISDSKAATIAFQITFFPNQGFSIGITMHHAMFDGKSVAMFMKSWAYICKENSNTIKDQAILLPLELTPIFDRSVIHDPQEFDMLYLNNWLDSNSKSLKLPRATSDFENVVRATFNFSPQDINKIRKKVVSQVHKQDLEQMHLSTFVLSYAYTLVSIIKAKLVESKGIDKVGFIFAANCRSRLDPPIPANYFGNCVIGCSTLMDVKAILEGNNGISFVASRLSEMIKGIETRVKNTNIEQEIEKILEHKKIRETADVMIGVAGSPQFEIYGTNFGWGKPKKTEVVSIDKNGSISMAESKTKNGGVDIGIVLMKHEMEMFNSMFVNGLKDM